MVKAFLFIGYFAVANGAHASTVQGGFEKLKSLSGVWTGTDESGAEVEIQYELTSDGNAVLERGFGMVTVYHLDGDSILASHHCSAGNTPRMRATDAQITDASIEFEFLDIANGTIQTGHIHGLKLEWLPDGRLRQNWKWLENSAASDFSFVLSRKI